MAPDLTPSALTPYTGLLLAKEDGLWLAVTSAQRECMLLLWSPDHGSAHGAIVSSKRRGTSVYRPGIRSPAWLKLKPKLTLDVVVTGGSAKRVRWGDWGEAVMLAFRYTHPRTGADVAIRQAVRVPRGRPFDLKIGVRLALVCWGVMPSGILRHPICSQ